MLRPNDDGLSEGVLNEAGDRIDAHFLTDQIWSVGRLCDASGDNGLIGLERRFGNYKPHLKSVSSVTDLMCPVGLLLMMFEVAQIPG